MNTEKLKSSKRFQILKDVKLILASSSPRRKQILRREGFEFEVLIPRHVEVKDISSDPVSHVLRLSKEKAESVLDKVKGGLILGADTIVVLEGKILGKPKDKDEAFLILNRLSGKTHQVYTGITLIHKETGKNRSDYDCTRVKFNQLKKEEILNYIATGEPMDKAGAYGIQGMGGFLVEGIQGELDNVIGLPVKSLKRLLVEFNSG
ncbi:MAG: hypothetical protein AMJ90_00660 [candidate division Zixibacteria bacterium SM23_73_2]|nr:MAG: hypothetical protein AMJ90_00660 [candidate division Zixibacteria bacterium SM23_73_2]